MTRPSPLPALDVLRSLFRYDQKTGKLFWRPRPRTMFKNKQACGAWNTKYAGKEAGHLHRDGYRKVNLLGSMVLAHRVCFSLANGRLITEQEEVDHKDGDQANDRPQNLRVATRSQNVWNQAGHKDRVHKLPKNVTLHKPTGRYCASFQAHYERIYLGYFATPDEAEKALIVAREKHHGEFARHSAK